MKTILLKFKVEQYDNDLVKGLVIEIVNSGGELIEVKIE